MPLLLMPTVQHPVEGETKVVVIPKLIGTQKFKTMLKRYRKDRLGPLYTLSGITDSKSCIIPREIFETLFTTEWDALRFYYGVQTEGPMIDKHNLILVTTKKEPAESQAHLDSLTDGDFVYVDSPETADDGYGVCPPPNPPARCPGTALLDEADTEYDQGNLS